MNREVWIGVADAAGDHANPRNLVTYGLVWGIPAITRGPPYFAPFVGFDEPSLHDRFRAD